MCSPGPGHVCASGARQATRDLAFLAAPAQASPEQWSEEHMRVLTRWKSQAFVHMYLQEKSNYYFRMIYNSLTFPVILLSSISSATLFTSHSDAVKVFVASVSIVCACLAALQRQVRPAEHAAHHGNTAHRYQTLIHRIESCMKMVPNMRPDVRKFVDKVRSELEMLLGTQNEPPRLVISSFEKRYGRIEGILYGDEIADMIAQSLRGYLHAHGARAPEWRGVCGAGRGRRALLSVAGR